MKHSLKSTLVIAGAAMLLCMAACTNNITERGPSSECPPVPLTEQFMSVINLRGENAVTYMEGSFESVLNEVFRAGIDKALEDSIRLGDPSMMYDPEDAYWYTAEQVQQKMVWVDTQYVQNPEPPHKLTMVLVENTFDTELFQSIRTIEQWYLNDSLQIKRKVKAYIPVGENVNPYTGEVRGLEPYFYVGCLQPSEQRKKVATVQYQQKVVNYNPNEYYPTWYRENLESSVREKLFRTLLKKAKSGGVPVYASPDSKQQLSIEDVEKRLCRVDTVYAESPEPPYEMEKTLIEECDKSLYHQVVALNLIQDVYVDQNMQLSIEMKWYAPVIMELDPKNLRPTGEERTLFWVKNQ